MQLCSPKAVADERTGILIFDRRIKQIFLLNRSAQKYFPLLHGPHNNQKQNQNKDPAKHGIRSHEMR
jgi:hypothetical protein